MTATPQKKKRTVRSANTKADCHNMSPSAAKQRAPTYCTRSHLTVGRGGGRGGGNCGRRHGAALRVRDRGGGRGGGVAAANVARHTTAADWLMMRGDSYCNTRLESRVYWP